MYNDAMTETQTTTPAAANPLTAAQADFIGGLLDEREGFTPGFEVRVREGIATWAIDKTKASEIIGWLLERPKRAKATGPTYTAILADDKLDIPAGHYAATVPGSHEPLSFFRVDRPTEGKWAGATFVKHIVGGHPDYPVKGAAAQEALKAINDAGIVASAVRYAAEFRRCLHCNLQLTDPISRAIGIGPHCRKAYAGTALIAAVLAVGR
jgi:hypothetical protein